MKYSKIKKHLKPYLIKNRKSTINHAFAAAISKNDEYDEELVIKAMIDLKLNPEKLECIYCGRDGESWDHVFATVENGEFSGYGHKIGNLLPCCNRCNSKKGAKKWDAYLDSLDELDDEQRLRRKIIIKNYLEKYNCFSYWDRNDDGYKKLIDIRDKIFGLIEEADLIAEEIRNKK